MFQDQWKKTKQTKEQAAAARRAKLDPDSAKSAKDVMDERARKRKLEEVDESDVEGVEKEMPKEGLKQQQEKKAKKQKTSKDSEISQDPDRQQLDSTSSQLNLTKLQKAERKRLKLQRKKEKKAKKSQDKKVRSQDIADQKIDLQAEDEHDVSPVIVGGVEGSMEDTIMTEEAELIGEEIEHFEAEGLEEKLETQNSTASPSPSPLSPTFDNPTEPSANTSTSSVIPPATFPKHIKLPTDPELLRSRLAAKIEVLRAARKADGPNGTPARNRQELMEARRKKEEQRRAHKKELRMKAKAEEDARREAALASARDSPASSMMSPIIHSPEQNFSFGRVAFADGQHLTDDLSTLLSAPRRKGPQDPATALEASEKKRLRIAGLDDGKRADIEEKDLWLNAKKRAHGEKVRDDMSLLKKTLKRKEKAKKKSEREWTERKDGIAKSQAIKQKKREENLRKRRDEKGSKGKGKGKSAGGSKGKKPKVKSRPGFEGSFGSGSKRR